MQWIYMTEIYWIEIINLIIGIELLCEEKWKNKVLVYYSVGYAILIGFVALIGIKTEDSLIFLTVVALCATGIAIKGRNVSKWICMLLTFLLTTCVSGMCGGFIEDLTDLTEKPYLEHLLEDICTFVILIILLGMKKVMERKKEKRYAEVKGIYILLVVVVSIILFTIAGLNVTGEMIEDKRLVRVIKITVVIAYLGTCLLLYMVTMIRKMSRKVMELWEREKELRDLQKNYYDLLLKKEEDTRRFRHDLNHHVICLKGLMYEKKYEVAEEYLEQVDERLTGIQKSVYVTGNEILDAIYNFYLPLVEDDIEVLVNGKCLANIKVDEFDLATIFSNLVLNALEGLKYEGENRYLHIDIKNGTRYMETYIVNMVLCQDLVQNKMRGSAS